MAKLRKGEVEGFIRTTPKGAKLTMDPKIKKPPKTLTEREARHREIIRNTRPTADKLTGAIDYLKKWPYNQ